MWSQGRFSRPGLDGDDMQAFARTVVRLGFRYVEISYVIPPTGVEQLIATNEVDIVSLHSPTPRVKTDSDRFSDALNLGSLDPDERALAVQRARVTIDFAARAGARCIVVHLGNIGPGVFEEELQLRRLYHNGIRDGEEVQTQRARALARRTESAARYRSEASRSLEEIVEHAARAGVAVALENRFRYHEIPDVDEMADLLSAYPADLVGFWLDVGHTQVLDRLGLAAGERWLETLADRCLGAHIHDTDGLNDHRAPGQGSTDWEHFARLLPPHVPRVLEINQKTPEEQIAASIPFLMEHGLLPSLI